MKTLYYIYSANDIKNGHVFVGCNPVTNLMLISEYLQRIRKVAEAYVTRGMVPAIPDTVDTGKLPVNFRINLVENGLVNLRVAFITEVPKRYAYSALRRFVTELRSYDWPTSNDSIINESISTQVVRESPIVKSITVMSTSLDKAISDYAEKGQFDYILK